MRHLAITETETRVYGVSRYYANGRRVPKHVFQDIKNASELDSFVTTTRAGRRRFRCVARISPTVLRSITSTL